MKKKKDTSEWKSLRLSPQMAQIIEEMAQKRNTSQSVIMRELLTAGLQAKGQTLEEEHTYQLVSAAIAAQLKPAVERLAAINAKTAQVSGAAFFMSIFLAGLKIPESERHQIIEAVGAAREQGIRYLKLKGTGEDIDSFMKSGAADMLEENN